MRILVAFAHPFQILRQATDGQDAISTHEDTVHASSDNHALPSEVGLDR